MKPETDRQRQNYNEYRRLQAAVTRVLSGVETEADYQFNHDYGGRYDDAERMLVKFNTGASLRRADKTKATMNRAKTALDADGRFGSLVHQMVRNGDYILIVQFGAEPRV